MSRMRLYLAGASTAGIVIGGILGLAGVASAAPTSTASGARVTAARHGMMRERTLLSARLAPSVPADPAIFGATPGGIPWVIREGHVRLSRAGYLQVTVSRLIDPQTGKNPLSYLAASVYCNGTRVATTKAVRFSARGNASLHAKVMLPAFCAAPAVLVNPVMGTTPSNVKDNVYIAFDGRANS